MELKALQIKNAEKDRQLVELENRVVELEKYSRINSVVVTRLRIKPQSYARVVTADNEGVPGDMDDRSAELQVTAFLQSKEIEVDLITIEHHLEKLCQCTCHHHNFCEQKPQIFTTSKDVS